MACVWQCAMVEWFVREDCNLVLLVQTADCSVRLHLPKSRAIRSPSIGLTLLVRSYTWSYGRSCVAFEGYRVVCTLPTPTLRFAWGGANESYRRL